MHNSAKTGVKTPQPIYYNLKFVYFNSYFAFFSSPDSSCGFRDWLSPIRENSQPTNGSVSLKTQYRDIFRRVAPVR